MPKFDLYFTQSVMNAAGVLGFAPDLKGRLDLSQFGAFVTNPISLGPRSPASRPQTLNFPGGVLVHTGFPNPGLRAAIRQYADRWARAPLPVIVHLLLTGKGRNALLELAEMISRLELLDNVMGVEVGLPPDAGAGLALPVAQAVAGELPLVLRLTPEQAIELAGGGDLSAGDGDAAEALSRSGAAAVSLGPPRGILAGPEGNLVRGRLYGPGMLPQALHAVQQLAATGIPVIGGGGVYRPADVQAMLQVGALAVQIDAALWRGWPQPSLERKEA